MLSFKKNRDKQFLIYKEKNYEIVQTDLSKIKNVQNWSKNRPVDKVRVHQIKEYYNDKKITFLPGILHIWKISDTDMYIYDGLHRMTAALMSETPNMKCLVKFLIGTENDVIEDFKNINRSVSLPFLYLEENNERKRQVCEKVSETLCQTFPAFVSPSRNPHKHNFNRDNIIDFISTLNIDFMLSNVSSIIYEELNALNFYAKDYVSRNKLPHPKKCQYYNFFLFYLSKEHIKNSIELIFKNKN